ncbi:glucokinase [Uliginosibacterium sp. H1]|uniref:glucokinase n=1 Tax=Uliginosibacterium sp. H1 TaxID=3114757 RepID=UPI002E191FD5|nr:glucokinase [Uliginosibacterium sp. H1]
MSSGLPDTARTGAATYPRMVGDIGGTNARFAFIAGPGAALSNIDTLPAADHAGPAEAIQAWLKRHGLPVPYAAAFGIANPVSGDAIRMTNHSWAFSIEAERKKVGLQSMRFINDFTALALSLPYLSDEEKRAVGGGQAMAGAAIGVIGAGTGLGVSGLLKCGHDWVPIAGEGGHVTIATRTDEEAATVRVLARQYGHVSAERALSGPGLLALYAALGELRGLPTPFDEAAEISEAAVQGRDPLCVDTCNMFCALLGTAASDLAVTLGARGGIYIGGGIVPKMGEFFLASPFRSRFEDKGRFSAYTAAIPTWIITAPYPALTGATVALQTLDVAA